MNRTSEQLCIYKKALSMDKQDNQSDYSSPSRKFGIFVET